MARPILNVLHVSQRERRLKSALKSRRSDSQSLRWTSFEVLSASCNGNQLTCEDEGAQMCVWGADVVKRSSQSDPSTICSVVALGTLKDKCEGHETTTHVRQ